MVTSVAKCFQLFAFLLIIPWIIANIEDVDFINRDSNLEAYDIAHLNPSRDIAHILARTEALEKELCDKKVEVAQLNEQMQSFQTIKQLEHENLQLELKLFKHMESKCDKWDAAIKNQQYFQEAIKDHLNCSTESKQRQIKESELLTKHCEEKGNKLELTNLSTGIYFFSGSNRLNWYQAFKFCAQHGLELASIESAQENNALVTELKRRGKEGATIWISGSDEGSEGNFYWANTGENMAYTEWHGSEPTNSGGVENCVQMWDLRGAFKWNDKNCMTVSPFICKVPKFCVSYLQSLI